MTDVELFYDPSCPWTWVTSRWLLTVAPERQLTIGWRLWSLPIKNEGKELPASVPAEWRAHILAGRDFATQALRVLQATDDAEGNQAQGRLYTELGRRWHGEGDHPGVANAVQPGSVAQVIADALAAAGLAAGLAGAAAQEKWDEPIRDNMDEVRRQVGDDVGTPIIAVANGEHRYAMSGPIMSEVPPGARAVALWDAVATMITEPAVFEMKRHRTAKPTKPALSAEGGAELAQGSPATSGSVA